MANGPLRVRKDFTGFIEEVVNDKGLFRRFLEVGDATELENFFKNEGFTAVDDAQGLWQARVSAAKGMTFTFESVAEEHKSCY